MRKSAAKLPRRRVNCDGTRSRCVIARQANAQNIQPPTEVTKAIKKHNPMHAVTSRLK